jgi:hypothetical protein
MVNTPVPFVFACGDLPHENIKRNALNSNSYEPPSGVFPEESIFMIFYHACPYRVFSDAKILIFIE